MSDAIRAAFRTQALGCRALNAPFTAKIIETLAETLDTESRTGRRILSWPGDPLADALKLRIAGGLHALARSGRDTRLTTLYRDREGDFDAILKAALREWDDWLYPWLDSPPQTNEVGRSGALMPGLMAAAGHFGMPVELLELGASAGLNLNLDRFKYDLGGQSAGDAASAVEIAPAWTGAPPLGDWPRIVSRAGVDRNPLDVSDEAVAERLLAYCWPDQPERLARLQAAIALARQYPPPVSAGDAADWIEERLAAPQVEGHARIVIHSVFWQYVPSPAQKRITAAVLAAGAHATADRPLAWLSFEPEPPAIAPMQLQLQIWPGGKTRHLAVCHPHGTNVEWLAA